MDHDQDIPPNVVRFPSAGELRVEVAALFEESTLLLDAACPPRSLREALNRSRGVPAMRGNAAA